MTWSHITDFFQTASIIVLALSLVWHFRMHRKGTSDAVDASRLASTTIAQANAQNAMLIRERRMLADALQASETENHHYRFFWQEMEYVEPDEQRSKLEEETRRRLHLMMGIDTND